MGLSKAVEGSDHRAQEITWTDEGADAIDLTGATISALKHPHNDGSNVSAVTGALVLSDATAGVFTWTYSAADIGTVGTFIVQFFATFGDATEEISFKEEFTVEDALSL